MLLFLLDNLAQGIGSIGVNQSERLNLFVEVAEDNALDCDGCCGNSLSTK